MKELQQPNPNGPSHSTCVENFYITNRLQKYRDVTAFRCGDWTYGEPSITMRPGTSIDIGKYSSIAHDVTLTFEYNHRTDWESTYPFPVLRDLFPEVANKADESIYMRNNITIGSNVWIGANVKIHGGAVIGDGAIIGADSVVFGKIPPYSIAYGNRAKVYKFRHSPEQIAKLLKIRWWDWPDAVVRRFVEMICSPDIEAFIKEVENTKFLWKNEVDF